jgi:nucleoside 2-deoxyribosyltransferase
MPAKLRCFVAMAFGHKDTDAIFKILRKTLGPLGINARRVDRIEHNDNIDTRIISEIEAADLVIADLTYARPSVYFEAGYAQRAIPVIFTARSDHFRERDNDPNGNRHVHFDLKMRNIIAWSSPNETAFPRRLTRRVTKVIAPLVRSRVASDAAKQRRSAFERLSTVEKGRALFDTAWSHFKRARYKELDLRNGQGENLSTRAFSIHSSMRQSAFVATKRVGRRFKFVFCQTVLAVPPHLRQTYYPWLAFPPYHAHGFNFFDDRPDEIDEDALVLSLGSGGMKRLQRQLPSARPGPFENTLTYDTETDFSSYKHKIPSITRHITYHVFESADRLARLSEILAERFPYRVTSSNG